MNSSTLKKLDDAFSDYIRLRDADERGFITCCTGGGRIFWKYADNGHYIDRGHTATRYHEKNCNAQSKDWNRFKNKEEMLDAYEEFLVNKYGDGIIDELESLKKTTCKISEREAQEMINEFRQKVKILKQEKGL